jgi:hypothetical protein
MLWGVVFSAFRDCSKWANQLLDGVWCVKKLAMGIVQCPKIVDVYLHRPSKSNAQRIVQMHKEVHGIGGMLGSLDVTKVVWEKCPVALKGQFQGKEKFATIGLEVVADDVWIWHNAFGFPSCLNNINILERYLLFESM